ncbi:hypothetical protein B0H11DRAFT_2283448 [Mycena galericulata]|nr:hypothetical protein B0H11DRAFT_2283448 [Mycena galericulata]
MSTCTSQTRHHLASVRASLRLQKKMGKIFLYFCLIVSCASISSGSPLDLNNTFFSPESDDLPEGTFIATGRSGVVQLAEYLTGHPEIVVARLVISDSTAAEVDAGYVCMDTSPELEDAYCEEKIIVPVADEEEERRENIQHHDARVKLGRGAVRDIEGPLKQVFHRVAPSLEALSYLTHMPTHSYDKPDGYDLRADHDSRIRAFLGRDYPSLKHLTFRNRLIDGATPVYDHYSRFPSITHLHLDNRMYNSPTLYFLLRSFPRLTHLFLPDVTGEYELPSDMTPIHPSPTLWRSFKEYVLRIPRKPSPLPISATLAVFVRPGFHPFLGLSGDIECGNPSIAYNDLIQTLAEKPNVNLVFPVEEEFASGTRVIPLRRAIAEFIDEARGGDGQWAIPGPIPHWNEWWWNIQAPTEDKKDDTEL